MTPPELSRSALLDLIWAAERFLEVGHMNAKTRKDIEAAIKTAKETLKP